MNDDESDASNEKLKKWAKFGIKVDYFETAGTVYEDPKNNNEHLKEYVEYLAQLDETHESSESNICIPLNPPIVPNLFLMTVVIISYKHLMKLKTSYYTQQKRAKNFE